MNEEALNVLYGLAQSDGYKKSFDEFKVLLSQNEDAVNTMYSLAQSDGYKKDIENFKELVGFTVAQPEPEKKKEDSTGLPLEDGSLEPQESEVVDPNVSTEVQTEQIVDDRYKDTFLDESEFDPFERRISAVTPELAGAEEEFVVPELKYLLRTMDSSLRKQELVIM
jgi:hypothetical protein